MKTGKTTIILGIIAVVALGAVLVLLLRPPAGNGKAVRITVDGEEYGLYPLDTGASFTVETPWGYNYVTIRDGEADVSEADCPNQICVDTAPAGETGDMIVCLPHRLVVEIVPEDTR